LILLLVLRLGFEIVGVLAITIGTRASNVRGHWDNLVLPGLDLGSKMLSIWQRWDALWYEHIARQGYGVSEGSAAFFPLYPALARAVSFVLGGNVILAELLLSSVAFVAALWLLERLVEVDMATAEQPPGQSPETSVRRFPVPKLAVLTLVFFPTGFFLLAPYTESVFLALTLATFWLARTGKPWLAGTAGFLASLTRPHGIFLTAALAVDYARRRGLVSWIRGRGGRPPDVGLLASALPAVGTITVLVFQRTSLGRTTQDVLGFWGYQVLPPWDVLSASWVYITSAATPPGLGYIEALNLVCLLAFAALGLVAARKLDPAYAFFTLPSLALLFPRQMFFSPLMSSARYVLVLFPCFIVLALWLSRRPLLAWGWLTVSALLQLILFQYWVRWGFVG
jgi:hypothetical protein